MVDLFILDFAQEGLMLTANFQGDNPPPPVLKTTKPNCFGGDMSQWVKALPVDVQ